MKEVTFRVDQLPGMIRALLGVQLQALERELLSPPAATARPQDCDCVLNHTEDSAQSWVFQAAHLARATP